MTRTTAPVAATGIGIAPCPERSRIGVQHAAALGIRGRGLGWAERVPNTASPPRSRRNEAASKRARAKISGPEIPCQSFSSSAAQQSMPEEWASAELVDSIGCSSLRFAD